MSFRCILTFLCFVASSVSHGKELLTLEKAQKLALESQNGLETIQKRIDIIGLKSRAIDRVYNPKLTFNNVYSYDNSSTNRFPKIKDAKIFSSDFEISKLISTGTKFKAGLGLGYQNTPFEELENPKQNPLAALTDNMDEKSLEPRIKFELSQSILKGWMAKEIKLQQEIAEDANISPLYQKKILSQGILYELELLYIQYTGLIKQIEHYKKVRETLQKIVDLMLKQKAIGRSDDLLIEKSRYRVLSLDLSLSSLDLERNRLEKTIFSKCDLSSLEPFEIQALSFDRKSSYKNSGEAFSYASKNRFDIKELMDKEVPANKGKALVKEQYRPELDLFVSYVANAKEPEFKDAFSSMIKQENPKVSVGLKFTWQLGGSAYKAEYESKVIELEALGSQRRDLTAKLKRDLDLIFLELETIGAKKALNVKKFTSLEKQKKLEEEKFLQARGGEVSLLAYDLERKEIEAENLALKVDEEMAISQIKHLTHSY